MLLIKKWVKFPQKLIPYIWLCFIFSFSFLAAFKIVGCYEARKFIYNIEMLTPKEKAILKTYVEKDKISIEFGWITSGALLALEKKNIIYKAYDKKHYGAVYNINQQYIALLKNRPKLIGLPN